MAMHALRAAAHPASAGDDVAFRATMQAVEAAMGAAMDVPPLQ